MFPRNKKPHNADTQALLGMRDDRRTCSLHEGIAVNRAEPLVLRFPAGIALQHLATHKRLLRLLEMPRGECGSHR
jgi:hypothetical protein